MTTTQKTDELLKEEIEEIMKGLKKKYKLKMVFDEPRMRNWFEEAVRKGYQQGKVDMVDEVKKMIDDEKEIVKIICLGLSHPTQENQKEFTRWLQKTVVFHLNQVKSKLTQQKETLKK